MLLFTIEVGSMFYFIFKNCGNIFFKLLCGTFYLNFQTSNFSNTSRNTTAYPVYKKYEIKEIANCKSICLLYNFAKEFEWCITGKKNF